LHSNADLTFGTKQGAYLISTIQDTQPKQSSGENGALSREDIVKVIVFDISVPYFATLGESC
jgi:hypothetical protein